MPKAKYSCKFRPELCKEFEFITKSSTGNASSVYCKYCRKDFSISAGGSNDIRRHALCQKHKDAEKAKKITKPLNFVSKNDDLTTKVR